MYTQFKHLIIASCFALGVSNVANAGTIDISESGDDNFTETVVGVYGKSQKISFSESGTYTMSLTDMTYGFGSDYKFDYIGAIVSTSVHSISNLILTRSSTWRDSNTFSVDAAGDYWLSIFAVTGDKRTGVFGINFVEGDVAPVPVPPAIIFMGTSLLGLISFARQRQAAKKKSV